MAQNMTIYTWDTPLTWQQRYKELQRMREETFAASLSRQVVFDGGLINLTKLWVCAGRPENRAVGNWLKLVHIREYLCNFGASAGLRAEDICYAKQGRNGYVVVHWRFAILYSRHLSPNMGEIFKLWMNANANYIFDKQVEYFTGVKKHQSVWNIIAFSKQPEAVVTKTPFQHT